MLKPEAGRAGRNSIDAGFANMRTDKQYLRLAEQIAAEFEHSDWEAWQEDGQEG